MDKREVVKKVLDGDRPPYVPWSFEFTLEALEKLTNLYGNQELEDVLQNHFLNLENDIGYFEDIGNDRFKDTFGVIWDRSIDKDIGNVKGYVLPEPTLKGYTFPDRLDDKFFKDINDKIENFPDCFRIFRIGFSLFERAWTLRGMESLLMDFYENPDFVHELLDLIADYNIAQIKKAMEYDIDAVHFGDDWGQQRGLIMGPKLWHEFIFPVLGRMYKEVKNGGKYIMIHSCGDVDELFDDLISIGLNCFNPFQPEVMDVDLLIEKYHGKLTFHGGLSTQRTLPFGSISDVKKETEHLLKLGKFGGYILSPAHAVEGDVPLENMLAFIECAKNQEGYK